MIDDGCDGWMDDARAVLKILKIQHILLSNLSTHHTSSKQSSLPSKVNKLHFQSKVTAGKLTGKIHQVHSNFTSLTLLK